MENKIEVAKAFTETYIILNILNLYNKLPIELQTLIEESKDNNYVFSFDKNIPLFNQVDNTVTRNLITYIYLKYINKNSNITEFFKDEINDIINQSN